MKKRVSVLVIELSSMNSTEKANININTSFILWKKQPLQKKKKKKLIKKNILHHMNNDIS